MIENHHSQTTDKALFGFWIYLMTDLIMFAVLFATFAVLRGQTFGGPGGRELFSLPFVLIETLILLTSTFTCALGMMAANNEQKIRTLIWFVATMLLGVAFLTMELNEFGRLVAEGHSWQSSAFLSSFFALVGTHGLHIAVGLLWMIIAMLQVWVRGLTSGNLSKLARLSMFWHFLDVVWIFIFTIVYLISYV